MSAFAKALKQNGFKAGPGLTDEELAGIEHDYGFRFPADLRQLLTEALPLADGGFPDWRSASRHELLEWLDEPADAIAEAVEEDGLWLPAWGARPDDPDDAVEEALRQLALAPLLIPFRDNLYLPARPADAGNPLFALGKHGIATAFPSVAAWLQQELGIGMASAGSEGREIEFWSGLERLLPSLGAPE